MKKLFYVSLPLLLLACGGSEEGSENTEETNSGSIIKPPLEGDFQNDTIFKIDPTKATTVSTPNGTSIEIPANVIVDKKGKPVKSKVEVSFVQYHSAADILASGIPMVYDSSGTSGTFQSAGMFTIHAESKGKEVFIKEGANIGVNLASDTPEPYNYYEMNEQNGDWTYDFSPRSPVRPNEKFDPSKFPLEPQEADKNAFVLDLNFDVSDYEELTAFSGVVWEYVGDHDSLDPRNSDVVQKTLWTDFELEPTYEAAFEYYLKFIRGNLSFVTKVRAALQGDDFTQAMADFQNRKLEIADEMDNLQKPYIRSVQIDGFGTFNYDVIHQMSYPTQLLADFDFGETENELKDKIAVFSVFPDKSIVANYPRDDWDKFAVDPSMNMKIMAILPGNKIAYFDQNLEQCVGKKEFTFKMKVSDQSLKTKADLENFIAGI